MSDADFMRVEEPEDVKQYGILRKSGRYPWGSGEDGYSNSVSFYGMFNDLKKKGIPEAEIAKAMGLTVAELRDTKTIARERIVQEQTHRAVQLRAKGVSIQKIAEELDLPQPTVRLRLKNSENIKQSALTNTADLIRKRVDEHQIVDIGKGTNFNIDVGTKMGISPEKLRAAVSILKDEGYESYNIPIRNVGTKNFTTHQVLVPPGTGFGGARRMADKIHTIGDFTENDGLTYFGIHQPLSISSSRLKINYKEDGGTDADGIIYVRPGVKDLDMGKNTYAQVRIMIDGTHYIKGMAVLKDDLPAGTDLVFNTNKSRSVGKLGALKEKESDPDNPFGSMIKRQIIETGKDGKERVTSALNLVNEPGDWEDWRRSLPSQMLAKQPHSLIRSQLEETRANFRNRLDEINKITNPIVKRKALEDFADQMDADAVDLRAAAMPRQQTQVIIPMPKMNKSEIYAPNFTTGERVVLIRYPHGGRFEVPEVVVNNNNRTAKKLLGNAKDAIGIHPSVATRLSGADFDGDTVVVIPNSSGRVKGAQSMGSQARIFDEGLRSFEPKTVYGGFVQHGTDKNGDPIGNFRLMKNTGLEMGRITNLITDMSVQGAKPEHILRAVKHSMVVIDAEKHKLNYKQSEQDHGIKQLINLYQSHPGTDKKPGGATTLLSRATAKVEIPDRKLRGARNKDPVTGESGPIDPKTGAKVYVPTGKTRSVYDPKTRTYLPEKVLRTTHVKRLELEDDAYALVRDRADPVERLYADHANAVKGMANATRLAASRIPSPKVNRDAKRVYKPEVDKLVSDLNNALKQKPLDRRADVIASSLVKAKRQEDPSLRIDKDRNEKVERQTKAYARARLGLKKPVIEIDDRQWDAIQAGAVSASRLRQILDYARPERVAELSMPRVNTVMTSAVSARAKAMLAAGLTTADVARALGVPASTLRAASKRGEL